MKEALLLAGLFLTIIHACTSDEVNPTSSPQYELLWEVPIPSYLPQGILLDQSGRQYIYVTAKSGGVLIFDQTDDPQLVAEIPINQFGNHHAMHLDQQGDYLYIALGDFFATSAASGLAIINVKDPTSPVVTDYWESTNSEEGSAVVIVENNHAYLGAMSQGIYVFDISDKSNIIETDQFIPNKDFPVVNPNSIQEPNARGLAIRDNDLYVAFDAGGIRVVDVTDKSNLVQKSVYINEGFEKQHAYNNIILDGDYAYTATDYCGMEILDISNPNNISLASWCNPWGCDDPENIWINSEGHSNQLVLDPRSNRVFMSSGGSEITLIDVSNPNDCTFISSYGDRSNNQATWGLTVDDNKIYATYITAIVPFPGMWRGIRSIELID